MHCHKENAISKESEGKGVTSMSLALLKSETSMVHAKHKKEHETQCTIDTGHVGNNVSLYVCVCVYCPWAGCMLTCDIGKKVLC